MCEEKHLNNYNTSVNTCHNAGSLVARSREDYHQFLTIPLISSLIYVYIMDAVYFHVKFDEADYWSNWLQFFWCIQSIAIYISNLEVRIFVVRMLDSWSQDCAIVHARVVLLSRILHFTLLQSSQLAKVINPAWKWKTIILCDSAWLKKLTFPFFLCRQKCSKM